MRGTDGAVAGAAPSKSGLSKSRIVLNTIRLLLQLAENLGELGGNEMRIQSAGVGKNPQDRVPHLLLLPTDFRVRFVERGSIGAHAEDRDDLRLVLFHLPQQRFRAAQELVL